MSHFGIELYIKVKHQITTVTMNLQQSVLGTLSTLCILLVKYYHRIWLVTLIARKGNIYTPNE